MRKRRAITMMVVVLLLVAVGYAVVRALAPVIGPVLTGPGCTATSGQQSVPLDTQQASIAATIAGVAHQQSMPRAAVTVAYATAMQESKLHNLDYGDMDSVGVFQQRPSQGWGPTKKLEDPVYATTKFFRALESIRGYRSMPVYQAAQAVQHSADGSAYIQYQKMAAAMTTAFTGERGRAVYCWSASWSSTPSSRHPNLSGVTRGLAHTFGRTVTARAAGDGHVPSMLVRVGPGKFGWVVAAWLVTHASSYRVHEVRFSGYQWQAAAGHKGWVRDAGEPPAGSIELS
jgi:hypothetical protein